MTSTRHKARQHARRAIRARHEEGTKGEERPLMGWIAHAPAGGPFCGYAAGATSGGGVLDTETGPPT